jgi:hypothetical protein
MKFPKNLVPQKAVAEDLCVSLVTLWRARRSGIPDFPEPVILRNMVFWRTDDIQQLEDALMRFEGRGKFEGERARAKRTAAMPRPQLKAKRRPRATPPNDGRQLQLL